MEVRIAAAASFSDPGRKVVEVGDFEVAVFRKGDEFFAYENVCPHLGGPACQGKMLPRTTEAVQADKTSIGRAFSPDITIVACPWHGMEFDIRTGEHALDRTRRLKSVQVRISEGYVYVTLPSSVREGGSG